MHIMMTRRFQVAPANDEQVVVAAGAICIGCGCTGDAACEGGCSWIVRHVDAGVCSCCRHALPAWEQGARLVGWIPTPDLSCVRVLLDEKAVLPYRPGTGQQPGPYHVLDAERGTVQLVDEQGLPFVGGRDRLQVDEDWDEISRRKAAETKRYGLPSDPSADQKRGQMLKQRRRRARVKASRKAQQAARRRS